jgi:prepilin-type N-terminal cleavage/methylation domain-containing protein
LWIEKSVRKQRLQFRRSGFTFIEVLATIMMLAIVMPVAMKAVSLSTDTARNARARTEAAGLAEAKLAELIATGEWQSGVLSGDFGTDWPQYRWNAEVGTWTPPAYNDNGSDPGNTVSEIDLQVFWRTSGGVDRSVTLSTLVYQSNPNNSTSTGSSSTTTGGSSTGSGNKSTGSGGKTSTK